MNLNEFLNDLEMKIINAVEDVDSITEINLIDEGGERLEIKNVCESVMDDRVINIWLKVADDT